jgi:hypothetical protein
MPTPCAMIPAAGMRLEIELLLCCARTSIDPKTAERIKVLLREDLDWAYLIRMADRHEVMPLMHRTLSAICPESVPPVVLDQLQYHLLANSLHNQFLARDLLNLLQLFKSEGVPAIPYKGPILAASVYGDLALRQFSDLDILIPKRDVLRAKDLLIAQGYRHRTPLTGAQEVAYLQSESEYNLVRDNGRVVVDLHWRIARRQFPFPLEFEHLQEHLETVCLMGTIVPNLAPEKLLLILCAHGSKHAWPSLQWICDVAELIRAYPLLNWQQVVKQADALNSGRMLALGLRLANGLLGVTLPQAVLQRVDADRTVKLLATRISARLFCEQVGPWGVMRRITAEQGDRLRVMEHIPDRLRYVLYFVLRRAAPTTKDQAFMPLPARLFFLYYLLRPIRLTWDYGLRPLRRIMPFRK